MSDDKQPQTRSTNDITGLGEAVSSFFGFFGKIIDRLPFSKMTSLQAQFILMVSIVNLAVFVLAGLKVIEPAAIYVIIGFDMILTCWLFYLANVKKK